MMEKSAAKKQQVLRQIRQEAAGTELAIIKQHAQGSMSILDMLSAGNAPPATLQLLQTIRHNVTARLGSMIENGMQSMLALEAPDQQQELSINQQAQRWTVQMYANKLGLRWLSQLLLDLLQSGCDLLQLQTLLYAALYEVIASLAQNIEVSFRRVQCKADHRKTGDERRAAETQSPRPGRMRFLESFASRDKAFWCRV